MRTFSQLNFKKATSPTAMLHATRSIHIPWLARVNRSFRPGT
jgi:hypothetical protein